MTASKTITPEQFAASVADGAVVAVASSGGGLLEADVLLEAIEARFLATGHPNNLTMVSALGFGDRDRKGMNRFANPGMTRRVICGHWGWSPRLQAMARANEIEAYSLPGGVISMLLRASGAGHPGVFTKTGLGTFVDPALQGGRINTAAREDLVRRIEIGGETYLHYLPIRPDVAVIKGTFADERGNVSLAEEPADLDSYAVALAAHNNGGQVVAQVRSHVATGSLMAREVTVPAALVSGVVVCPDQPQTRRGAYSIDYPGRHRSLATPAAEAATGAKRVIALRAAAELRQGASVNFGFGVSAAVYDIMVERGEAMRYSTTIEQGIHDGRLETTDLFGMAVSPNAIVPSTHQFDFYQGGGIDITFLGMAECDGHGNVNVSHFGEGFTGPGGFIDISQNARKVVFCGTFDTRGSKVEVANGALRILEPGAVQKLVGDVAGITFSGEQARLSGQSVLYVTERAVFELTPEGVELIEVAEGIDLQRDVLDRMGFAPIVRNPRPMPKECFQ